MNWLASYVATRFLLACLTTILNHIINHWVYDLFSFPARAKFTLLFLIFMMFTLSAFFCVVSYVTCIDHSIDKYRIAGKFGRENVWRIQVFGRKKFGK